MIVSLVCSKQTRTNVPIINELKLFLQVLLDKLNWPGFCLVSTTCAQKLHKKDIYISVVNMETQPNKIELHS